MIKEATELRVRIVGIRGSVRFSSIRCRYDEHTDQEESDYTSTYELYASSFFDDVSRHTVFLPSFHTYYSPGIGDPISSFRVFRQEHAYLSKKTLYLFEG